MVLTQEDIELLLLHMRAGRVVQLLQPSLMKMTFISPCLCKEILVLKGLLDHKDLQELKEHKDLQELKEQQELKVLQELLDLKDLKELLDLQDQQVDKDLQELQVLKVNKDQKEM
jgi:hypothetical protein